MPRCFGRLAVLVVCAASSPNLLAACTGQVSGAGDGPKPVVRDAAPVGEDGGRLMDDGGRNRDAAHPDGGTTDRQTTPCEGFPGAEYPLFTIAGEPTTRPAEMHADLNVELRGWEPVDAFLGLIDVDGPGDPNGAPQLDTLFADDRIPIFAQNYQIYDWDWGCDCRAASVSTTWEVSLSGFVATPGESLEVPDSGYDLGDDHDVIVLYVGDDTITLKYTRDDSVVIGYTLHVAGLCVDPALRAAYDRGVAAGRRELPALRANQPFGRARSNEVIVAIRDSGSFMDPRVRKDWW